ncbi:MAG: S1C family serine protease [Chloroflexaceae bacterium]
MRSQRVLSTRSFAFVWLLVVTLTLLSACNQPSLGGQQPTTAPKTPPESTEAPTVAPAPTRTTLAIRSLDDVRKAVVQIEAEGSFVAPGEGTVFNVAGRGSGFIIDESGIAVTNNHVVTGSALLRVFVNGESRPRNARILGVSECSDLAVIDIDGNGYPFLEWYDGDIKVGLDVFAAGYPLGDPEFTLTRGIISKARANGETSWASVDNVVEHDATINPGNSGGPLLSSDGRIVGVNYAGRSDTNQYFAIARDEALPLIEQLRGGQDVTSLGINGEAFALDDGSLSGIWVWSVKSGSPADKAGVRGGDIVTQLERLVLATDGRMTNYCDILRSRTASDTLQIAVVRSESDQVLEGQINGRELEETVSFARGGNVPDVADTGTTYEEYYTFENDARTIRVDIPRSWSDTSTGSWRRGDSEVPRSIAVVAAPDINGFLNTWTTPGMFLGASRQLAQEVTPDQLLDQTAFNSECTYDSRNDYSDPLYTGRYDVWTNCGGQDTALLVVAFTPEDRSFLGMVQVQVVSEADLEALDRILDSFVVEQGF